MYVFELMATGVPMSEVAMLYEYTSMPLGLSMSCRILTAPAESMLLLFVWCLRSAAMFVSTPVPDLTC